VKQKSETIGVATRGPGLTDVTQEIARFVGKSGIDEGVLTVFLKHTSASLVIQENADSDVLRDIETFMSRLVSRDMKLYRHTTEGPDDMPAHIRSALTQTSLSIPVQGGAPALGTWQAIYLFEHRDAPHRREIALHLIGE
jgi:secondary thiamine-phosphate synthase enzyme